MRIVLAAALGLIVAVLQRPDHVSAGSPTTFPQPTSNSGCQVQNSEPDPTCTPGAVFNVPTVQICQPGYGTNVSNVTQTAQAAVYGAYGITYPQPASAYQVDHLVPVELGGSNDIANLWPEAASPFPGYQQKDALATYLHIAVCTGAIDLATAQTEIATDWVATWYAAAQPG
jgi:hypothetical protein